MRGLVGTISNPADETRVEKQLLLFNGDAQDTSDVGGKKGSTIQGR